VLFWLKKILKSLLLPPGIFSLALAAAAVFMIRRRQRGGAALLALAVGSYLMATGFVANQALQLIEVYQWDPQEIARADVIIVLGGGFVYRVHDLRSDATPMPNMMCRLVDAIRIHRQIGKPVILSGGRMEHGPSEARVYRDLLIEFGIPPDQLLLDEDSRDTVENAANVVRILRQHHFRRPLLVTSACHLRRAALAFESQGVHCALYPSNVLADRNTPLHPADFLATPHGFLKTTIALQEMVGLGVYQCKNTLARIFS